MTLMAVALRLFALGLRGLLFLAGALLALAAFAAPAETYVPFRPDLPLGAACQLSAEKLHPTQLSLGWREGVAKKAAIEAKDPAALEAYLKDKDVPIVIGPGGVPYLTDGHHTLRALLESSVADKTAYGHVLANWSALEPAEFWRRMQDNNYVYLKNAAGQAQPPGARRPRCAACSSIPTAAWHGR
jgi:hypothetical protein